jgi:hypothetical protein
MFNLFKKRTAKEFIEEAKETYLPPEKEQKKPEHTFYRVGMTDANRVSFSMGYSEFTMDRAGCNSLIAAITTFRDMLPVPKEETNE